MTNIRTLTITGFAAFAMIAGSSLATPTEAHAGGKHIGAAILGGIVAGAIIGGASRSYAQPSYGVVYQPQPRCWKENQFVGYDGYGRQVFQRVTVCN